ncbi:hypothetical protein PRIPAC_92414 [Pristionchus pacificus]|uniref:Uncharacterized protein n=1 Tax=Pristionchus pacificus TaxID=54126 RepID=A0A2A6C9A7_PRIPA|nr:hypothetical protein PRIPAC_92414 [Pristionchus pacificus]|eukprot:PDM74739.1 hypothetical protein PRIPAC_43690 [Pristionchus pacificus]
MSSRVLIYLLLLVLAALMVDGSLQESDEEQRRQERELNNDKDGIAIDVEYKNGATKSTTGYRTFVDVAMLSSGFVFVAVAFVIGMVRLSTRKTVNYETIV